MKKIVVFLLAILFSSLVIAADDANKKEQEEQKEKVEEQKEKKEEASTDLPADYYKNLGIPAITRAWGPYDYLTADGILSQLATTSPKNLPHYNDPTGRIYMQHMVDGQNLYQTLRFANTQDQRLVVIMSYLDGIQRLFSIYQQAITKSFPYQAEWVDIIGLSSYLAALSEPTWVYFLQAGSNEKIQAINMLQTAIVNPVITGIQTIPQLPTITAYRLLQHLNYTLPIYQRTLPLPAQEQLQQALQQSYRQTKDLQIQLAIKKLIH